MEFLFWYSLVATIVMCVIFLRGYFEEGFTDIEFYAHSSAVAVLWPLMVIALVLSPFIKTPFSDEDW